MRSTRAILTVVAVGALAAACGSDNTSEPAEPATAPEPPTQTAPAEVPRTFEVGTVDGTRSIVVCCDESTTSAGVVRRPVERLQAVGDSILGWNQESDEAISDVVGEQLGVPATNNAVGGATLGGDDEPIGSQYVPDGSTHVLITGGGNDLSDACGREQLDRLIAPDGSSGLMIDLVDRIGAEGAQSVIVGYYLPSDLDVGCTELIELAGRYRALAQSRDDVVFVSTIGAVTPTAPTCTTTTSTPTRTAASWSARRSPSTCARVDIGLM